MPELTLGRGGSIGADIAVTVIGSRDRPTRQRQVAHTISGLGSAVPALTLGAIRWHRWRALFTFLQPKAKFDSRWVCCYGAIHHRRDLAGCAVALLRLHIKMMSLLPRPRRRRAVPVAQ